MNSLLDECKYKEEYCEKEEYFYCFLEKNHAIVKNDVFYLLVVDVLSDEVLEKHDYFLAAAILFSFSKYFSILPLITFLTTWFLLKTGWHL